MKIIEKHNQDDSGTSKDVGRRNIDSWLFLFFILLFLALHLLDWIPYLKHKIKLMDTKSMVERGNESGAKKNIAKILNNSKNKNVIAEALYLQVLYRLTSDDIKVFGKLKAFHPNSKYVSRLEVVLERAKVLREKLVLELKKLGQGFVYIQPGTFMMGSPTNEPGRNSDETQHRVTLTKSFYMQTNEVTQGQWKEVMGNNPSHFKNCGDDCPVERVSWDDVQEFIRKLNLRFGHGITYRLPTEAEWEYAARAGSDTAFASDGISVLNCEYDSNLDAMGWYCGNNANGGTHPVAQKQPNAWGLYDMHGNVEEWCQDWYGDYPSGAVTDPTGPSSGSRRVFRSGCYYFRARSCRSASRSKHVPEVMGYSLGFRLLRN